MCWLHRVLNESHDILQTIIYIIPMAYSMGVFEADEYEQTDE